MASAGTTLCEAVPSDAGNRSPPFFRAVRSPTPPKSILKKSPGDRLETRETSAGRVKFILERRPAQSGGGGDGNPQSGRYGYTVKYARGAGSNATSNSSSQPSFESKRSGEQVLQSFPASSPATLPAVFPASFPERAASPQPATAVRIPFRSDSASAKAFSPQIGRSPADSFPPRVRPFSPAPVEYVAAAAPVVKKHSHRGSRRKAPRKRGRIRGGAAAKGRMATKTAPGPLSLALYILLCVLTVGAGVFFGLSEWRLVSTRREFLPFAQEYTPASCEAVRQNEGKLVHIDCPLRRLTTFYPPADFSSNLDPFRGVFFEMVVEMFQWEASSSSKLLGSRYRGRWSANRVDSSKYSFVLYNSHTNPGFFPRVDGEGRQYAEDVYAGDYRLTRRHLLEFRGRRQLSLKEDGYYQRAAETPPLTVSSDTTQLFDNALYTGDPLLPKVGDLRITFWGSTATHASVLAMQQYRHGAYQLAPYQVPRDTDLLDHNSIGQNLLDFKMPHIFDEVVRSEALRAAGAGAAAAAAAAPPAAPRRRSNLAPGTVLEDLVQEGDASAQAMLAAAIAKRDGSQGTLWAIRTVFVVLLTATTAFTYRLFDPTPKAVPVPLVAGSFAVACGITAALWAPLWIHCSQYWTMALLIFVAAAAISSGCFIWALGRKCTDDTGGAEQELAHLREDLSPSSVRANNHALEAHPAADHSLAPVPGSSPGHFYQPL